MGGVCTACSRLGRDGVARGHVLDLRRDIITSKGEVLARVRRVGRLGDRLFQSSGVLVLEPLLGLGDLSLWLDESGPMQAHS